MYKQDKVTLTEMMYKTYHQTKIICHVMYNTQTYKPFYQRLKPFMDPTWNNSYIKISIIKIGYDLTIIAYPTKHIHKEISISIIVEYDFTTNDILLTT